MKRRLASALPGALAAAFLLAAPAARAGVLPLPVGMPPQLERAARRIDAGAERHAPKPAPAPSFELKDENGYRIRVNSAGTSVAVVVQKRGVKSESIYLTRGAVSSRRLKASFGALGEIDMRFHPGPAGASRKRGCGGEVRRGTFTGRFRFRGEGSYLRARAHRAAGEVRLPGGRCEGHGARARRGASDSAVFYPASVFPEELEASWRDGVDAAEFVAFGDRRRTFYLATAQEVIGRVATLRIAFASAAAGKLRIDTPLTAAGVSAPAPFHGRGTFRADPDGKVTWAGPLAVNFPGLPRYPLTGNRYRASVWRSF